MHFIKCSPKFPAQDLGLPLVPPKNPESPVDFKSFMQKVRILSLRMRLQSPAQLRTQRIQMNNEYIQDKKLLGGTQVNPTLEIKVAEILMRMLRWSWELHVQKLSLSGNIQMPYPNLRFLSNTGRTFLTTCSKVKLSQCVCVTTSQLPMCVMQRCCSQLVMCAFGDYLKVSKRLYNQCTTPEIRRWHSVDVAIDTHTNKIITCSPSRLERDEQAVTPLLLNHWSPRNWC